MEIGKPKRTYTIEPIVSPIPIRTTKPDAAPAKRPPAERPSARA
jgi:hypothetical protein